MTDGDRAGEAATVVVSYGPVTDRIEEALDEASYRGYLRRAHEGESVPGEEWTEFVSGGCGSRTDVSLRVEALEGGSRIDENTTFVFRPRE